MISSWPPSHDGGRHGFYLPPPINFAAYKTRSTRPVSTGGNVAEVVPVTTRTRYADSILFRHPTLPSPSNDRNLKRSLTPSSSGSSLSSLQSSSTRDSTCLSDQARHELRSYANSFDQARDWKRRVTLP
ncbi:MAG: hypothetical protein M1838_006169 [Thelocarpon superellum]|nr:MAG: hypothetical protein M1838_006169 [Thelocarpon superellum]